MKTKLLSLFTLCSLFLVSLNASAVSRQYIENFESYSIGTKFTVLDSKGNASSSCTAVVAEDPVNSDNKVLKLTFGGGTYGPQIKLPSGSTVNSLTSKYNLIAFDCYLNASDSGSGRKFFVLAGNDTVYFDQKAGSIASKKEIWTHKRYRINQNTSDAKEIVLGYMGGLGNIYIDNIRFADLSVDQSYLDDEQKSIRFWADLLGKDFGAAINSSATTNATQSKVIAANFNTIVAEWEMKFSNTEQSRNVFNYKEGDALYKFAKENGMKLRGHCLVWHESVPSWVSSDGFQNNKKWSKEELQSILKNHIMNVAGHYKGKVYEWDVLNECLDNDQSIIKTNSKGYNLRHTVWYDVIGESYIDSVFVWARRADPNAKLYLNDYGNEQWKDYKAQAFYNLVKKLRSRNVPIDGVGLQTHYGINSLDSAEVATTIYNFKKMGIEMKFTEIDISMTNGEFYTKDAWESQAKTYRTLANFCRQRDFITGMLVWGLGDAHSWVDTSSKGQKGQALILDYFYGMKPAYKSIREVFKRKVIDSGLMTPEEETIAADNTVYDLMGRARYVTDDTQSIYSLPKGIYIYNGHKYVVK